MKKEVIRRLEALPRKVALPLRHLADIGQIKPSLLETVLDAGELAGNTQHLLGFAAGVASLEMQEVPATDTIRMAKEIGAPIRLDWTPRRWREEHDRMSRIMTYRSLRAQNIKYDVSSYEEFLPVNFPGYVVSSRRRLATIGYCQRHCVASYHDAIVEDRCAIVCVNLDGTRWTVEVQKTGNSAAPLRIQQIKTTDNRNPNPSERGRIIDALGVRTDIVPRLHDFARMQKWLESMNNARVCEALLEAGVEQVKYQYDTSPGILPPEPLRILPESADISGRKVEMFLMSCDVSDATVISDLPTEVFDLQAWLQQAFVKLRNHYETKFQVNYYSDSHPTRWWDMSFEPLKSTIETKLVARSDRSRRRPREDSWSLTIPDRSELEDQYWPMHY